MIGEHYEDWELLAYIDAPSETNLLYGSGESPMDTASVARHVDDCSDCASRLNELRSFTAALADKTVFEEALRPPAAVSERLLARARRTAEQLASEKAGAESTMKELLALPWDQWSVYLDNRPLRRTAGLVRRFIAEARGEYERRPTDALEILEVASGIADRLADPRSMAAEKGAVAKERANALRYLGRYPEALEELEWAEQFSVQLPVHAFELALILRARATLLFYMTRYDEALDALRQAIVIFRDFGEILLIEEGRLLEAAIIHEQGDFAGAFRLYTQLRRALATSEDVTMRARIEGNLAECSMRLGNAADARNYAARAIALYHQTGNETERARVEWTIAYTELREGNLDQADAALTAVQSRFEALGMRQEAAEILLDLIEIHVAREAWPLAASFAARAVEELTQSECPVHVANAVAYLQEAVRNERASAALVQYVRDYVILGHPSAEFAPPRVMGESPLMG
jgi:tetratricopeptide (TPR) repeat protein